MEIQIIEPITKYSKEFNTPDEFNVWYSKHKNDIDAHTTHKLNKLYHINGYRITKIKGVLMLKKWNKTKNDELTTEVDEHSNTIKELQDEITKIKESVNTLISFINTQFTQQTIPVSPPSIT